MLPTSRLDVQSARSTPKRLRRDEAKGGTRQTCCVSELSVCQTSCSFLFGLRNTVFCVCVCAFCFKGVLKETSVVWFLFKEHPCCYFMLFLSLVLFVRFPFSLYTGNPKRFYSLCRGFVLFTAELQCSKLALPTFETIHSNYYNVDNKDLKTHWKKHQTLQMIDQTVRLAKH